MKLHPVNNRVVVKPDEAETKTDFGLLIQKEVVEKPTTGVVSIGNKKIKSGQRILFSKFGYDEVVIDKELLYVISEHNILGIFK